MGPLPAPFVANLLFAGEFFAVVFLPFVSALLKPHVLSSSSSKLWPERATNDQDNVSFTLKLKSNRINVFSPSRRRGRVFLCSRGRVLFFPLPFNSHEASPPPAQAEATEVILASPGPDKQVQLVSKSKHFKHFLIKLIRCQTLTFSLAGSIS